MFHRANNAVPYFGIELFRRVRFDVGWHDNYDFGVKEFIFATI